MWQNLAHGSLAHHSRFVKHIHVNPRRHSARGDRPEFPRTTLPSMICMQLWLCNFRATFISLCATFTCLYILVHTNMHAQCSKKICVCNNRSPFVTVVVLIRILFSTQIVVPINFLYSKWIHESERREKERIQKINILVCIISINFLPFSRESYFTIQYNAWDVCIFRRKYYFEYRRVVSIIFFQHILWLQRRQISMCIFVCNDSLKYRVITVFSIF